jgi:hypothetical protein
MVCILVLLALYSLEQTKKQLIIFSRLAVGLKRKFSFSRNFFLTKTDENSGNFRENFRKMENLLFLPHILIF